jgi:hypothetical protein
MFSLVRTSVVWAALILGLAACSSQEGLASDPDARQKVVAERAAAVMPFDLDRTTHVFKATSDGLVQRVIADDMSDEAQISLIRAHLAQEAERFRVGDYGDPIVIHGAEMPGVETLSARASGVDIVVAEIAGGAEITYTADDADLVQALHVWGDAQVVDHGSHAERE